MRDKELKGNSFGAKALVVLVKVKIDRFMFLLILTKVTRQIVYFIIQHFKWIVEMIKY